MPERKVSGSNCAIRDETEAKEHVTSNPKSAARANRILLWLLLQRADNWQEAFDQQIADLTNLSYWTSAKTGDNVEAAFLALSQHLT